MRLTLRGRLTLFSAVLFLFAGGLILFGVYLVVERQLVWELSSADADARISALREQAGGSDPAVTMPDGSVIDLDQLAEAIRDDRAQVLDVALSSLLAQGSTVVLVVAAAAAAGGWITAGRGLRPLGEMTRTAERIAASTGPTRNLHERIGLTGRDDEVKRLGDAFDAMLSTLDHAFDGQRRFTANASHQLRTPLAVERAMIEVETTRPGAPPELVRLGRSLLEVNEANTRLIDGLLLLGDAEQRLYETVPVDLARIASAAAASTPGATAAVIDLVTDLSPAPTVGDPVLLEHVARNLLHNAVRYNNSDRKITVTTRSEGGAAVLEVGNTGAVMQADDLPELFEPFRRGRVQPAGEHPRGFGLGLAVVKAITAAHGGLVYAHPRPNGGLTVTVRLDASE